MRSVFGIAVVLALAGASEAHCDDKSPSRHQTFAIETFVGRTYNYLDTMVDKDGLPYFDIFWTDPAEAAHDWPDFGDVMSRQLQAAIMARHLTGEEARNEKLWTKTVLSYLDPKTGLLMRPKTSFSEPVDVFYGKDGPGPLYQREQNLENIEPKPTPLHMDDGSLDFWWLR